MAYSLTWLPDVLLDAHLKVAEVDGWQTRGLGDVGPTFGVLCHHTGGGRPGNMPALNTLVNGRSDLRGPLAQLGLGRDGTFYVVAAGLAHHAGSGVWMGVQRGNRHFIGIEAQHSGRRDDPWPDVQLEAYQRGVAAILRHLRLGPERCAGHKEYATPHGRKPDPCFDMHAFRVEVSAILSGSKPPPPPIPPLEPTPRPGQAPRPTLRRGVDGPAVHALQTALGLQTTGVLDAATEMRVRAFQRLRHLVPDGIVGPKTWRALDEHAARPA